MDAKKFGTFLAAVRKEQKMTQADLAQKLHVTDKAVSKWERGLGFPDINTIEPLADALGISILEIMRSERIEPVPIPPDTVAVALTYTFDLVKLQRKTERRNILKIVVLISAVLLTVFMVDGMGWMFFVMAYLPLICLLTGISLIIYGIIRKRNKLPCAQTFLLATLTLLVPLLIAILLFLAGYMGIGPVPT